MGEFQLITDTFQAGVPIFDPGTSVRNGDDASVHKLASGEELVISSDMAVEGVHWPHDFPLQLAADKAVCAALSDLAAMGAEARWAWLAVACDDQEKFKAMGEGAKAALKRYWVELAGGDTVRASQTSITVTVGGSLPAGKAMRRNQANKGDGVWIIGKAGFSSLGLKQWQAGMEEGYFKRYFEEVKPKLEQGGKLRQLGVKCCIDISDGVLQDASHVAMASGIGMALELSDFPGWDLLCRKVGEKSAIRAVVSGGEDYALLFTAPPGMGWLDSMATKVGVCTDGIDVEIQLHGTTLEGLASGYDHFA